MAKSCVAGIIDKQGGLRVVVTTRYRMKHHVGEGEKLYIVPRLRVQEPIAYKDSVSIIEKVVEHINKVLKQ